MIDPYLIKKDSVVAESDDLKEQFIPFKDLVSSQGKEAKGNMSIDILILLSDQSSDFAKFCS